MLHYFLFIFLCCNSLSAGTSTSSKDGWFGPGFYYGHWFSKEDKYNNWRSDHLDYPPSGDYYNPTRPITYESDKSKEVPPTGGKGGHGGGGSGGGGR